MKVSVIIPCYNEKNTIGLIVDEVLKQKKNFNIEVIIVDDFSNDGTKEILENETKHKVDKILFNSKNFGKGYSVNIGIKNCSGEIVIIQDADLEYNPSDYKKLLNPILNDKADAVFGSRFIGSEEKRVLFFWHFVANKILTLLSNMFTNLNLTDMETGYKAVKKNILDRIILEENRFGFEPEITAKIAKLKPRIYEVGISYSGRTYEEGKKIRWHDAISALKCIVKYNLF